MASLKGVRAVSASCLRRSPAAALGLACRLSAGAAVDLQILLQTIPAVLFGRGAY